MQISILLLMIILSMVFLIVSITLNNLIFAILSVISWLITSVSTILLEFPTGYSSAVSYDSPLAMFFYGLFILSVLWAVILVKNFIVASAEVKRAGRNRNGILQVPPSRGGLI